MSNTWFGEDRARVIAIAFAASLFGLGFIYVLAPAAVFGLVGGTLPAGPAATEFRATYGGVHIALSLVCLLWRSSLDDLHRLFTLISAVVGIVALVRIGGVLLEPRDQMINLAAGGVELLATAATLACARELKRLRAARPSSPIPTTTGSRAIR